MEALAAADKERYCDEISRFLDMDRIAITQDSPILNPDGSIPYSSITTNHAGAYIISAPIADISGDFRMEIGKKSNPGRSSLTELTGLFQSICTLLSS